MGQVLLAGEEPHEWPAALRDVVADRAAQHRIPRLQSIEDRALRDRLLNLQPDFSVEESQPPQMSWEHHSDHCSVCTSTDRTDGRSLTMGAQLSPESAEA